MEGPKKKSSSDNLERLQKSLYSRVSPPPPRETGDPFSGTQVGDVPASWKGEPMQARGPSKGIFTIEKRTLKKILWGAAVFFVLSLGVSAYMFFGGINSVSTGNVDISISGPASVGAGEPLSFSVAVHNQNNTDLQDVNFLIEYPPGTRTADEQQAELLRESEPLGTIPAGGLVSRNKRATLFGEAGVAQHIIVSVQYRVKDSSATYFKEQYYDVLISSAPVSLKISSVNEAVNGSQVDISAEIVSNSSSIVSGLMLKVDYPYGFAFSTASPAPVSANNIFLLGDLNPADRRVIHITGTLTGQEGDSRSFRFTLGLPDKQDAKNVGTAFLTNTQTIAIKKPFVSANLTLNGSGSDPYTIPAGQLVQGQIAWANNLPSRVVNLQIQMKLTGDSLNRLSVSASGGFYRSIDNTIVWDKTTSNRLAVVEPGDSDVVSFTLSSLPTSSLLSNLNGNEISLEVSVTGQGLSDANIPQQVVTSASRKIRISSNLGLTARSLYFTGPFGSQGPIPPAADRNTTYTIDWAVTNSLNDLSGVQVQAALPNYVTWLGNLSPSGESVSYDPSTRIVTWDVGDVAAGTGFSSSPREVFFQVSLVPSLSQLGTSPNLTGPAAGVGTDRFSGAQVNTTAKAVSTKVDDGFGHPDSIFRVVQ